MTANPSLEYINSLKSGNFMLTLFVPPSDHVTATHNPCYVNNYYTSGVSDVCDSESYEEDVTESVFDEVILILLR